MYTCCLYISYRMYSYKPNRDCPFPMQSAMSFFTFFVSRSEFDCLKFEFQIGNEMYNYNVACPKRLKCLWVCWIFNHSKMSLVFTAPAVVVVVFQTNDCELHTQTIIFGKFPSIIVNDTELLKAPTPPQFNDNSIKFDGNKVRETHTHSAPVSSLQIAQYFFFNKKKQPNFKETEENEFSLYPWLCFRRGAFKTHQIITKTHETTNYPKGEGEKE